jgi:hypothetical protein
LRDLPALRSLLLETAAALIRLGPHGWDDDEGPLGTVVPISESERLYMGARHTLVDSPMGIMTWHRGEGVRTSTGSYARVDAATAAVSVRPTIHHSLAVGCQAFLRGTSPTSKAGRRRKRCCRAERH